MVIMIMWSVDCSIMMMMMIIIIIILFIGESLRMGKSSLGKRKTSACPVRVSSLGPVGEVPEQSARK